MKADELENINDKSKIVDYLPVKESFINALSRIHKMSTEKAEVIYEKEALYFKKAFVATPKLKNATGLSLYSAFLEIAITGLSIQPGSKSEAYLEARGSVKEIEEQAQRDGSIRQVEVWKSVARLAVSAYGELSLRIKAGQIIRMNNPIVIYEGDKFQPRTNARGEMTVEYEPAIPRKSKTIVGVWCSIILPGNGIDFKWLLKEDIDRLAAYSIPKKSDYDESSKASALYSSNDGQIDPGFLEAKCIKHALRAYTKLRLSDSVVLEEEEVQEEPGFAQPATKERETVVITPEEDLESPF
jgi:recombinational DNA repair protein RecT